jgi:hypothetical protein
VQINFGIGLMMFASHADSDRRILILVGNTEKLHTQIGLLKGVVGDLQRDEFVLADRLSTLADSLANTHNGTQSSVVVASLAQKQSGRFIDALAAVENLLSKSDLPDIVNVVDDIPACDQ